VILLASVNEKKKQKINDETLMSDAAGGDVAAFGELVERHQVRLRRFIFRYIRDEHTATEIAQEAFMKAYEQRQRWVPKAKFTTWLFTIGRNLCIRELRKMSRRPYPESTATDESQDFLDTLAHGDVGPEETTDLSEQHIRAIEALAELPEIYRETVVLRVFENLPYAEIATITDAPVGRLRVRMHEALRKLREKLL
jgi:RNA polymerase sigma-70 factor (ECF subfamily)